MDSSIIKNFFDDLISLKLSEISFVRGYGIVEDYFILIFENALVRYKIEIETNFRIVDNSQVLLVFNDLYLDADRREISVRRYRNQQNIEKTLLFQNLNLVNERLKKSRVVEIKVFKYGDIVIFLDFGVNIEISNDTHKENATLYRIYKMKENNTVKKEVVIRGDELFIIE